MKKHTCLITTSYGIMPTLTRELKYLGVKPYDTFDTGVYVDIDFETIARLNLRLRTGTKIWLLVDSMKQCIDFDDLFSMVEGVNRNDYITPGQGISVQCNSYKSTLHSERTLQSITHKAILNALTGLDNDHRDIDHRKPIAQIRVQIAHEHCKVFINTSGKALHERGYREETGEAPLKEHIAAALVLMTSRGYSLPLIDPCCGSGTIPIEAAMIASNRAPGIGRSFACERFPCFDFRTLLGRLRVEARQKIYDKPYEIFGYDVDESVLEIAKNNAYNAGVENIVQFAYQDCTKLQVSQNDTLITNPPYGKRIGQDIVDRVHDVLFHKARYCKATTIISGYEYADELYNPRFWKVKPAKNGPDDCDIYLHIQ